MKERIGADQHGLPDMREPAERSGQEMSALHAITRRTVLSGAMATSMLAVPAVAAHASSLPGNMPHGVYAVFDRKFPQSLGFAEQAGRRGIRSLGFSGDMSGIWFDHVLPEISSQKGVLVGLTGAGALFCFEQLAWDLGQRVRLRIDHVELRGGFEHAGSANLPMQVQQRLDAAGGEFGSIALDAAMDCRTAWGDCTHRSPPTSAVPEKLVTWVISPVKFA